MYYIYVFLFIFVWPKAQAAGEGTTKLSVLLLGPRSLNAQPPADQRLMNSLKEFTCHVVVVSPWISWRNPPLRISHEPKRHVMLSTCIGKFQQGFVDG